MSVSHLSFDYKLALFGWIAVGLLAFYVLLRLRRRWRLKSGKKRIANCGLSLWMLLAALTLVELYFATIYDQSDSFNMTNVSKKWFALHVEPDQKLLALDGNKGIPYRDDRAYPKTIPEGTHHICFLGDSFAFGHGVPDVGDRFSNRVRASLEKNRSGDYVVSNLSKTGENLHYVELVLQQLFAHKHRVDTVVYVMCLNDIETFHPDRNKFYQELGAEGPQSFLFSETYFFNFLYFRYRQFTRPAVRSYYAFVKDYYRGDPWQRMQAKLKQVDELCRRNGTKFCVVVFPFLHNLGDDYAFRSVHRQVVKFCKNAEIPVLDLDPVLTPHVEDGLTVNRFDAHPNERAHELAAEAILPFLQRIVR